MSWNVAGSKGLLLLHVSDGPDSSGMVCSQHSLVSKQTSERVQRIGAHQAGGNGHGRWLVRGAMSDLLCFCPNLSRHFAGSLLDPGAP